jgi:hypothetical protein
MGWTSRWVLAAVIAPFALAAPAQAAQRYVSPTGGGGACTQGVPCSIVTGINASADNDEVIVTPGTYTTSMGLTSPSTNLSIHGQAGQPRPVIATSATTGLLLNGGNSTVRDLTFQHSGTADALQLFSDGSLAEHLEVHSSAGEACFVGLTVVFRDSLCVSAAAGYPAIRDDFSGGSGTATLRNVTAIATGINSTGLKVGAGSLATNNVVNARNVILQGATADATVTTSGSLSTAALTLQRSNFDSSTASGTGASVTAPGTGTNQIAPPIFADTTTYHQALGSPTINAGAVDASTGTSDLDGDLRTTGSAPDIGVDEFVPAVVPPPDTTPPETTIDKGPARKTKSRKATFKFSSNEPGSSFECKVDSKPAKPCTSPLKLKHLKRGKHKLAVAATDAAGNTDATPATYKWKVKKPKRR